MKIIREDFNTPQKAANAAVKILNKAHGIYPQLEYSVLFQIIDGLDGTAKIRVIVCESFDEHCQLQGMIKKLKGQFVNISMEDFMRMKP